MRAGEIDAAGWSAPAPRPARGPWRKAAN